MTAKTLIQLMAAAALSGCAQPGSATETTAALSEPPFPAAQVAGALADAADAANKGDRPALARALAMVEHNGARPADDATVAGGAEADPVVAWRASVADIAPPPFRGSPLGPGYRIGRLSGGGRESFNQLFLSGTGATIALSAPTGDRVSLRVLDPRSRPVCSGDTVRIQPCRWVPLFTQRYTIEVTNLGNADARYFLVVQ